MKKVLLAFVAVTTLFVGCKDEPIKGKEKTGVSVFVTDFDKSTGTNLVYAQDVEVKLYKTLLDAINDENEVAKKITNSEGRCSFDGLEEREYYILIKGNDCLSNIKDLIENKGEESKVKATKVEVFSDDVSLYPYKSILVERVVGVIVDNRLDKSIEVSLEYGNKRYLKGKTDKYSDETLFIVSTRRINEIFSGKIKIKAFEPNSTTSFKTIELNVDDLDCSQPKRVYIEP